MFTTKDFPAGSRARVLYVKLYPELQGREGTVVGTNEHGQVAILLDDDDGRTSYLYASTDLAPLPSSTESSK